MLFLNDSNSSIALSHWPLLAYRLAMRKSVLDCAKLSDKLVVKKTIVITILTAGCIDRFLKVGKDCRIGVLNACKILENQ